MIELALIRSLMQKDFYDEHKGSRCPDRLFSKDVRKIKGTLDQAMGKHERNLSLTELQALFFSDNGTMTWCVVRWCKRVSPRTSHHCSPTSKRRR